MISSDEGQGFRRIAARIMELIIRRWYEMLVGDGAKMAVAVDRFLTCAHAVSWSSAASWSRPSSPRHPGPWRQDRIRICLQVGRPPAAWSGYNFGDVRKGSTRWGSSSGDPLEDNNSTG